MTDDRRPGAADDPEAALRSLQRRLRREKRTLERLNPLEEPDRYAEHFTRVIDLEADRRELRGSLGSEADELDEPDAG
ncbi:MAG: hypothetical protein KY461_09330 [Actinobacteria bacterium]|nr:hypothetical protein [Actinomycetota bacterium]